MKRFSSLHMILLSLVSLAVGYLIPRGHAPKKEASSSPVTTRSAKSTDQRADAHLAGARKKFLLTIPASNEYTAREKWLENLSPSDVPVLIDSLCVEIGPDGLGHSDKSFLDSALEQWWTKDREGALAWATNLPVGPKKTYFMSMFLAKLLKDDSSRALALSEAFQQEDPTWKHRVFQDKHISILVDSAWKKPGITAAEMLSLYGKLSRGGGTSGTSLGRYPENFDFQTFLDSIVADNAKDKKRPSMLPSDVLEGWARVDPQAAAQWFLNCAENQISLPFQQWGDIGKAVSLKLGPQAYHEWAAEIIGQTTERQRKMILESIENQDAIGISNQIQDIEVRDQVMAMMARKNSGATGEQGQTLEFLGKISTPAARLQALENEKSQYTWWTKRHSIDASAWQKIGLTQEQVATALAEKP